jgi:hypothetical protein
VHDLVQGDTVGTCGIVCFTASQLLCILVHTTPSCLVNLDLEWPVHDKIHIHVFVLHDNGVLLVVSDQIWTVFPLGITTVM